MADSLPGADEQERILADARSSIKRHAFSMRKAIDEENLREALRFSAAMLGELRTSQLSPQKYYELYMLAFDQLVNLEAFFADETKGKGKPCGDLYELVQHAGNVLPRLYLMVAVGCLYIKSKEAKSKEILKDLVELCKGVQHPTRGLFLRSYLCQRSKGLLPDTGSEYEDVAGGGDVNDAIEFLQSNFVEMNKLWVRMQHQGTARDREKREVERQQLQDLVGRNLTYLSQLDGLDFDLYASRVLPRVLEQVTTCKDGIAQQYLMQCIIQGFPDAFHLGTMDSLLAALPELQPEVKVHTVMASFMDRLAKYAQSDASVMQRLLEMGAFEKLKEAIARVLFAQPGMASADKIEMFVALMGFTGNVHPNIVSHVNEVLSAAFLALAPSGGLHGDVRAERHLLALLTLPITKYDVVTGLGLTEYPLLMGLLRHSTHKDLAKRIVRTVVEGGTLIASVEKVRMLFRFIRPLVRDDLPSQAEGEAVPGSGVIKVEDMDEEDVEEEQVLVAKLIHCLVSEDPLTQYEILKAAKEELLPGGHRRVHYTLPALSFSALKLIRRILPKEPSAPPDIDEVPLPPATPSVTPKELSQWVLGLCTLLVQGSPQDPMTPLRIMLVAGTVASEEVKDEMIAYQFFEEAFTLYEESVSGQRHRVTALESILGALQKSHVFGEENRDTLVQNAMGYASRLLKRSDQCRVVCGCSYLSWQAPLPTDTASSEGLRVVRDASKVLLCLKRALKIAQAAKTQAAAAARSTDSSYFLLYLEILEHYVYYLDKGADGFTPFVVQSIMDMIQEESKGQDPEGLKAWSASIDNIKRMQKSAVEAGEEQGERAARLGQLKIAA